MSQLIGKRIMMVVSNFASFVLWIMMAQTYKVQFITLERFAMGVVSAGAIVCVGKNDLQFCHTMLVIYTVNISYTAIWI